MAFVTGVSTQGRRAIAAKCSAKICLSPTESRIAVAAGKAVDVLNSPRTLPAHEKVFSGDFGAPAGAGGKPKRVLMWFHTDIRLDDNEALLKAIDDSKGANGIFLPVFIIQKKTTKGAIEAASELRASLRKLGSDLVVVRGEATEVLPKLCRQHRIDSIYHNKSVSVDAARTEKKLSKVLEQTSASLEGFWSNALFNPTQLSKHSLSSYGAQAVKQSTSEKSRKAPTSIPALPKDIELSNEIEPKMGGGSSFAAKALKKIMKETAKQQNLVLRLKEQLDCGSVSPKMIVEEAKRQHGNVKGRLAQEMVWRTYMCSVVNGAARSVKQTA